MYERDSTGSGKKRVSKELQKSESEAEKGDTPGVEVKYDLLPKDRRWSQI